MAAEEMVSIPPDWIGTALRELSNNRSPVAAALSAGSALVQDGTGAAQPTVLTPKRASATSRRLPSSPPAMIARQGSSSEDSAITSSLPSSTSVTTGSVRVGSAKTRGRDAVFRRSRVARMGLY